MKKWCYLVVVFIAIAFMVKLFFIPTKHQLSFEGCFGWSEINDISGAKEKHFVWFLPNGRVYEGKFLHGNDSEAYINETYHRQGSFLFINTLPEWQNGGLGNYYPWTPATFEDRRYSGYFKIEGDVLIARDSEDSDVYQKLHRISPPKKINGREVVEDANKVCNIEQPISNIEIGKKVSGVFVSSPLNQKIPTPYSKWKGRSEYLEFVDNRYVCHGVLLVQGKRLKRLTGRVYTYQAERNMLRIYIGLSNDLTLIEEGTISKDGKRIHLTSKDFDAIIGPYPLDRTLIKVENGLDDRYHYKPISEKSPFEGL